ncbi:Mitogen-activated protein kinase kinase 5 [Phytophthora pseudosyringae]|uniref:Mitogen-activated protein kinase kinase 5 n=1 Tax=Phytophthora pseudosyringae TaxID=221518 RepID=A0A8T1WJY3_9STRA|nr:Mitogen-activated protein kinase kinase 5 [Phytophthora pseudosyringae]
MPEQQSNNNKKNRHVSKPAAVRETSSPASGVGSSSATSSHRRDLLDGSIQEVSRQTLMERFRKRGRVESANYEQRPHTERDRAAASTTLQSNSSSFANTADGAAPLVLRAGRAPHHATFLVHNNTLARPQSAPNLAEQADDEVIARIFPDICPRELRIAEVKSWECPWMKKEFPVSPEPEPATALLKQPQQGELLSQAAHTTPVTLASARAHADAPAPAPVPAPAPTAAGSNGFHRNDAAANVDRTARELDNEISSLTSQLSLEEKRPRPQSPPKSTKWPVSAGTPPPVSTPLTPKKEWKTVESAKRTPGTRGKRPQLRLKLEDMPTPQQAEERAQRAATRLIAKRDAMEAAAIAAAAASGSTTPVGGPSAVQQAMMKLNFSSGSESDPQSPSEGRHSGGSAYSPNHGMFTTKNVAVSEAGISSPDAACLHLQENLERVKEIGRGASGVVYKAIHIPTLKVVAVKDVPVYGRGQRRQMVRELHALYSNLVPMADTDSPLPRHPAAGKGTSKPKATPSPYIVSFYDAFVDRPKNSICMVMEYMSTGSLQDIVLRGGCQKEMVIARLATGVLHGLAHIHNKRMVHRDIKPHNLLTNRQGEVKISDFGLARTLNDNSTTTKTFVGTLLYMAPERIGGGDYSYPADVWSFGLALISVALGRYPLPTQDGFFGLVDSVANEQCLKLPAESYSEECRSFIDQCLIIDPDERPSAEALLQHPFIHKYTAEETLAEWVSFVDRGHLCEEGGSELESLGDAVYRHMYEHSVKFSHLPQSDYGVSFVSQATPTFSRRQISLQPVQMSLQLGLANYLDAPVHLVYEKFEEKRCFYSDKLLEDYCYSPQSWTASPGISRRQQFGIGTDSPQRTPSEKGSFWRKLQESMAKLGHSKRRKERERGRSSAV